MIPDMLMLFGKFSLGIIGSLSESKVPEEILSALIFDTKNPSPLKKPAVIIPVVYISPSELIPNPLEKLGFPPT